MIAPLIIGLVGLEIPYPHIHPVALQVGPLAIKWYGLAYLTGLLFGWLYIRRLLNEPKLWANDKPGFGVDIDEAKAALYPISIPPIKWTQSRWPDGTMWTP